jgi:hypothetical protein
VACIIPRSIPDAINDPQNAACVRRIRWSPDRSAHFLRRFELLFCLEKWLDLFPVGEVANSLVMRAPLSFAALAYP